MPRINKVIVIAAKKRDLLLRSHHEPHVVVTLEPVIPILAAAVKRNNLAPQPRRTIFLDRRDLSRSFRRFLSIGRAAVCSIMNSLGDIVVRLKDLHIAIRHLKLISLRFRIIAVLQKVAFLARKPLDKPRRHMMIRRDQPIRRNKNARSPRKLDRSQPQLVHPLFRRLKIVLLLPLLQGWIVKSPHAVVGNGRNGGACDKYDC